MGIIVVRGVVQLVCINSQIIINQYKVFGGFICVSARCNYVIGYITPRVHIEVVVVVDPVCLVIEFLFIILKIRV